MQAAEKALRYLRPPSAHTPCLEQLPAFEVLGAIHVELGDPDSARRSFEYAAQIDATGEHAGAEKFLWLAQLSEEGGKDTISWFDKGAACLRAQLAAARQTLDANGEQTKYTQDELATLTEKLASALCGAAEVYMTDLSFEDDCEEKCEALVQEAIKVAPKSSAVLQTLANVRISQQRIEEAREILERSISAWESDLVKSALSLTDEDVEALEDGAGPNISNIPEFATRISLCRLLMEVDMCQRALTVLERLVQEDDSSVEAWYLGGWCQHLIGTEARRSIGESTETLSGCRRWLSRCLKEYENQEYEDDRLREHALELKTAVDEQLGSTPADDDNDDDAIWQEEEDDGQMAHT